MHELYRKEILEIMDNLRTLKRQLKFLRVTNLPDSEKQKLILALQSVADAGSFVCEMLFHCVFLPFIISIF